MEGKAVSHLKQSDQQSMEHNAGLDIGERRVCSECGRWLIYTSAGWKHAGVNQPRHMAIPAAMPEGSVWVGDAPPDEEDWPDTGSVIIGKGINLSDKRVEQILAASFSDEPGNPMSPERTIPATLIINPPKMPPSVADLYRVLSEQLTPAQQTMLKAFWLLMAEDSRMLDWLESQIMVSDSGMRNGLILVWSERKDNSLRAIIKERMQDDH